MHARANEHVVPDGNFGTIEHDHVHVDKGFFADFDGFTEFAMERGLNNAKTRFAKQLFLQFVALTFVSVVIEGAQGKSR
ncbi:hypothetical protein OFC62_32120, partial [Escherichia coli]|nr:hypothetical protein [Escherichia coli]